MKQLNLSIKKWCLAALMLGTSYSFAATFTAIASGNWTTNATWQGGVAPGTTIDANDDIIINSGVTVSMDQDVTLNGFNILLPGGSIQVNGTLMSTNSSTLYMNNGDLTGTGTIMLDRLEFSGLSSFNHSGMATVATFQNSNIALSLVGTMNITDSLILEDGSLTIANGSTLDLTTNSHVKVNNGAMTINGGTFANINAYTTYYVGSSKTTGIEATGSGMTDLFVMLDNGESLSMGSDLSPQGNIMLSGGNLDLNGFDLTISNDFMTSNGAMLEADPNSSLNIFSTTEFTNDLEFATGSQSLGTLHVDDGGNGTYVLNVASDLNIANELYLQRGKLFMDGNLTLSNSNNAELKIAKGDIVLSNGATFDGSNTYNVTYFTGDHMGDIVLSGSGLNNVTLDLYNSDNMVELMSDLTLDGDLNLMTGAMSVGDYTLTINGNVMSTSEGSFAGNGNSNLIFSSNTAITDTVNFHTMNHSFNKIMLDFATNADLMIGSNLMVDTMDLNSGSVVIFDSEIMMDANSEIMGADENNYIKIEGQGKLAIEIDGTNQAYIMYPVGTMSSFSPAHLQLTGNTTETFSVNVKEGVMQYGNSGYDMTTDQQLVDRTWDISSMTSSSAGVNMKLNWSAGMEVNGFDRTDAYITHYTSGSWDETAGSSATTTTSGMFEISRNGISSFSPFAITDKNSTVDIEENSIISAIYPNPSSNLVYVQLDSQDDATLELMDASGRIIETQNSNGVQVSSFDLTELPNGIYFVRVSSNGQLTTKRIIKS